MLFFSRCTRTVILVALVSFSFPSSAIEVSVQYFDVPDSAQGDIWLYRYELGGTIQTLQSVRVDFDALTESPLSLDSSPAGWFVDLAPSSIDPFPSGGYVLFSPVLSEASVPQSFDVSVIRQVAASFPTQTYELLDSDFNTIDTGSVTVVPEPRTLIQLLAGLIALIVPASVASRNRSMM